LDYIFFTCFVAVIAIGISAVSKDEQLKKEIEYDGTKMNLYCLIQNSFLSTNKFPVALKSDYAKQLFNDCVNRIRLGSALIIVVVFGGFIFG